MRKRTTRREKHAGSHYYDAKTGRHEWSIRYKGKKYSVKDRDEATAKSRFAELKTQLFSGIDVHGARVPLGDYLPRYIDTEVSGKASTRADYHKRADLYILPTFGEMAIGDIKRRHITAWVTAMVNDPLENGRYWSRNSIKQALGLLRRALDAAIPEYLEHNPAAGVRVPMHRKNAEYEIDAAPIAPKVFTADQMRAFLAEVWRTNTYHGFAPYFELMIEYGWRRGEGLGLRRKDIDFDAKTITINQQVTRDTATNAIAITIPKSTASRRALPASDATLARLREQCLRVGAARPNDLLFPGRDGEARQPNGVTQHFRRICQRLGFAGYTLHSLRKYAITDWRTEGMDLEVAAAMAGHAGVKVTAEVYSQATMERKRAAMEKRRTR